MNQKYVTLLLILLISMIYTFGCGKNTQVTDKGSILPKTDTNVRQEKKERTQPVEDNKDRKYDSCINTVSKTLYKISKHSNFKVFWHDFKKAVFKGDKSAVLKMTSIPFKDENRDIYDAAYGSSKSLTSRTAYEFLNNYDKIFNACTKEIINNAKYKTWGERVNDGYADTGPGLYTNREGYLLVISGIDCHEPYSLSFEKKDNVFKLSCIPYQE